MALVARVEGVGLVGPGLSGWEASRAILAGREPYTRAAAVIPAPEALPLTRHRLPSSWAEPATQWACMP